MIIIFELILFTRSQVRRNWAQLWVLPTDNQSICLEKKEELTTFYHEAKEQCKDIGLESQENHPNCSFYSRYRGVFCASEKNYSKVMSLIPNDVKELEFYSYVSPEEGYDLNKLKGKMIVNIKVADFQNEQRSTKMLPRAPTSLSLSLVGDIKSHVSFLIVDFQYEFTYLSYNKLKIIDSDLNVECFFLQGAIFAKDSMNISVDQFIINYETHTHMRTSNFNTINKVDQYSIFVGEYTNGFQVRFYNKNHWAPYKIFDSGAEYPIVREDTNNIPYEYANSFGIILTDTPKVSLWSENENTQIKTVNISIIHDFTITPRKPPMNKKSIKDDFKYNLDINKDGNWPKFGINNGPRIYISHDMDTNINYNDDSFYDEIDMFSAVINPYDKYNINYGNTWSYKEVDSEKKKSNLGLIIGVTVAAVVVVVIIIVVVILVIRKRKTNKSNSEQEEGAQQ